MRLSVKFILIVLIVLFNGEVILASVADELLARAEGLEKNRMYSESSDLYKKAMHEYLDKNNIRKADICRAGYQRIQKITMNYSLNREEMRDAVKKEMEGNSLVSDERIESWLDDPRIEKLNFDGGDWYFNLIPKNMFFRNLDIIRSNKDILSNNLAYYNSVKKLIDNEMFRQEQQKESQETYSCPVRYNGEWRIKAGRERLPQKGVLKLWIPLPVETEAQKDIQDIAVIPEEFVVKPPDTNGDIGSVYLEVPLEKLTSDLDIKTTFSFTRYAQAFTVDPYKIKDYDRESLLYKKYTASGKNIAITDDIRKKAIEIAGHEQNPYFIARRIYSYVVNQREYSLTPHFSLDGRNYPESVYVHNCGFGDCGAQSAYFSALCRAAGIPARTTGGYQMITGRPGGHFWAEFYLEGYGWLPVDTSVAQIPHYIPGLSAEEQWAYIDFFFGNMDPYRLVIQKDIDIILSPEPEEPILLPMALQEAAAVCSASEENPGLIISDGWEFNIRMSDQ